MEGQAWTRGKKEQAIVRTKLNNDKGNVTSWERSAWTRLVFCVSVFILIWTVLGCVTQGEYEAKLNEIQALRQENVGLKDQLAGNRQKQVPPLNRDLRSSMNTQELLKLLSKLTGNVEGNKGAWKIVYKDVPMVVLTSPTHNRMRIVSPIGDGSDIELTEMRKLLESNFDRALDGRYALYNGNLWSVYLHPLSSLTEAELTSALKQVANLVKNYGSTYSSSHLRFQ